MYARTMRAQLQPGRVDELLRVWRDDVLPAARQQPGFRGATLLVDHTERTGISITRWDSLEELEAGEANGFLQAQVAKLAPYLTSAPERHVYEIALEDIATPAFPSPT